MKIVLLPKKEKKKEEEEKERRKVDLGAQELALNRAE